MRYNNVAAVVRKLCVFHCWMYKWIVLLIVMCMVFTSTLWVFGAETNTQDPEGIDYMVLVNKTHPLPEDWENKLKTVHITNSVGDECMNEENLSWLNEMDEGKDYTQVAEFFCDFQTGNGSGPVLEPNTEYKDYQWWLARRSGEGWQLITMGY